MVKFGIIGAGRIAETFANSLNGIDEGILYAVASRNKEKANAFKEKFNVEKAYDSYQAMYEDPALDCVYVATPHGLHYEQMLEILDYKKHILCEKAFTLNHKQAEHVFKKAKEQGVFVMEAMWTRFLPTIQGVMGHVIEGTIGEITHLDATFSFEGNRSPDDRLYNKELGGGALLDIGIYPITLANLVLGPPAIVDAHATLHKTGVDYYETIMYEYENGAVATLKAGFNEDAPRVAMIYGTKGKIHIPNFWSAEEAYVYDKDDNLIEHIKYKHPVNGFEYEIKEVISCIEENRLESNIMPHETTIRILKQMDSLRKKWGIVYPQEVK
jgi:predicted dehydrogenase